MREGLKGGQTNADSHGWLTHSKRADDRHMKPSNGSMSKEAESPWTAPHRDQGSAPGSSKQILVDHYLIFRAGTSSEVHASFC